LSSSADYLRVCDICGHEWPRSKLKPIGQRKLACPDDYPGYHEVQTRRLEGQDKPFPPPVRPRRDALESSPTPLYQEAEGAVFNLVLTTAPDRWINLGGAGDGALVTTVQVELDTVAWSALYLYELLAEDRRPNQWVVPGQTRFRALVDTLLANQLGSPTLRSSVSALSGTLTPTSHNYGGLAYIRAPWLPGDKEAGVASSTSAPTIYTGVVPVDYVCPTVTTAVAGLAFLRAYQLFDEWPYRDAYLRCLTWLHRALYPDLASDGYPVDAGGARYHVGTWPTVSTNHVSYPYEAYFKPTALVALDFLTAVSAQSGDIAIGDATAVSAFGTQPEVQLISEVVAEVKAFWQTGGGLVSQSFYERLNGVVGTTKRVGFGATPYEGLSMSINTGRPGGGPSGPVGYPIVLQNAQLVVSGSENLNSTLVPIFDFGVTGFSTVHVYVVGNCAGMSVGRFITLKIYTGVGSPNFATDTVQATMTITANGFFNVSASYPIPSGAKYTYMSFIVDGGAGPTLDELLLIYRVD
jgi:hypothetical protein